MREGHQGAEPSHDACPAPFHKYGQSRLCCLGRPDVQCQDAASLLTYLGPLEAAKGLLPKEYLALLVQHTIQRQRPSRVGSHMRRFSPHSCRGRLSRAHQTNPSQISLNHYLVGLSLSNEATNQKRTAK